MNLTIYRHTYNTEGDRNVIGDLFIDGVFFCHTLEDEKRADGVKEYGKTCIPDGKYFFEVTLSNRFKRKMILIKDVPMFSGIRMHGGNTSKDTLGCPLVAFNTDYKKIWGTAERKLTKIVMEAGGEGYITILDKPFTYDKVSKKLIT